MTMHQVRQFLACRRGAVALESALAAIPLVLCLVGIFEIVQTIFIGDLLQRSAYRTAYANALRDNAAASLSELRTQVRESINTEVGNWLSFELADQGACKNPPDPDAPAVDFCLKVTVSVYDNPTDMLNNTPAGGKTGHGGGDAKDMVVVKVVATPKSHTLSELQQRLFGTGLEATAVRRNERLAT